MTTKTQIDLTTGEQVQGTLPVANGGTGASTLAAAGIELTANKGASSGYAGLDANSNASLNNVLEGYATTATAGTTTTLTIASKPIQVFTGTSIQTVTLATTSVPLGYQTLIINQSTGAVTVNASGGTTAIAVGPGASAVFTALAATPTTASQWNVQYGGLSVASGKVLTVNNSLTLNGVDGTALTFPTGSGIIDGEQFCTLTSAYTLTSQTAAQKLFNSSSNGAVTLPIGTYAFDCMFTLSAMSASSGSFGFAMAAGTATIAGQMWQTEGVKAVLATAASAQNTVNTAANTTIVTATTATVGWAHVWGKLRISVAGTVIPSVSLGVAAAAIVGVDSYFRIWQLATSATAVTAGTWS